MLYYIGVSEEAGFDEIVRLFNVDYSDPNEQSFIESAMGGGYVGPENYEIYDRMRFEKGSVFDRELIADTFPFESDEWHLWDEDFSRLRCVFFLESEVEWGTTVCDYFRITDVLDGDSLKWKY